MKAMMRAILVAICLVVVSRQGTEAKWKNVNKCGTSIYPDAGEGLPPLSRIVGGDEAREYEFPYQVGFWNKTFDFVFCGGVLITYRWVVTAAHCLVAAPTDLGDFNEAIEIRIGEFDTTITGEKEKARKADKVIIHEDYNPALFTNDIALVRMNRRVGNAQGRIRPICRPEAGEDYADQPVIASGWGLLAYTYGQPDALQYVSLYILPNADCATAYMAYPGFIQPSMVCTTDGQNDTERNVCFGDSGGPVAAKVDGRFQLVGLPAFVVQCEAAGFPAGHTRVTSFLDWIDSIVGS